MYREAPAPDPLSQSTGLRDPPARSAGKLPRCQGRWRSPDIGSTSSPGRWQSARYVQGRRLRWLAPTSCSGNRSARRSREKPPRAGSQAKRTGTAKLAHHPGMAPKRHSLRPAPARRGAARSHRQRCPSGREPRGWTERRIATVHGTSQPPSQQGEEVPKAIVSWVVLLETRLNLGRVDHELFDEFPQACRAAKDLRIVFPRLVTVGGNLVREDDQAPERMVLEEQINQRQAPHFPRRAGRPLPANTRNLGA